MLFSSTLVPSPTNKARMLGMEIDAVDMRQAVTQIREWLYEPATRCRYVVTPNVDHAVQFQRNEQFRAAQRDADLVLADGFPLVAAAKLLGEHLPERVAGSELVPELLASFSSREPVRVFLLGAAPGVAKRAARRIEQTYPGVRVVGTHSPPRGFEHDPEQQADIERRLRRSPADLLIVGLGAPKQELWVHKHRHTLPVKVAVCAGATIDFLAGEKPQAPMWMRRNGLEWLHRLATEPRRLASRYAEDAVVFPRLVWRELRSPIPQHGLPMPQRSLPAPQHSVPLS